MHFTPRFLRAAGTLALSVVAASFVAPTSVSAQAAPAPIAAVDSLAFPRQFVKWIFAGQGDSAFTHAAPMLRESMKSAADVSEMPVRLKGRFGELQNTQAEVQFDEGPLKVYISVLGFSQAPEPAAWVVVYSPATKIVERSSFSSLTNVKSRYPMAKLP